MPESVDLSPFQKEKLLYYFKFFEPDENNILNAESMNRLFKKIFKYTGWQEEDRRAVQCLEIHQAFFEVLFEKALEEGGDSGQANLEDWYAIWSHLLPGVKGMSGFPIWLRLMPKVLFQIIDRNDDDRISYDELITFYQKLMLPNVTPSELELRAKEALNQMTDNGKYVLDQQGFEQIFANFLIGKTPHGPGKYLFGCFEHDIDIHFTLIQLPTESDEDK